METPCRFVRFVVPVLSEDTSRATGLFQIKNLWRRRQVPEPVRHHVASAFEWYGEHLPVPPVVKKERKALCWFRREPERPWLPDAHEPLRRAFVLASYLRSHRVRVETLQTADAGELLYEDRWQIVAVPRETTRTGRVEASPYLVVV